MSTEIVEFSQFESDLAEYQERYKDLVYDMSDPGQEKQARSDRYALGKTLAELDRAHKAVKAPLKAQIDVLDGERKRIKDGLLAIQTHIKDQITEHEAALQRHDEALLGRVEAIRTIVMLPDTATAAEIHEALEATRNVEVDESFEKYQETAEQARARAIELLSLKHERAVRSEEEAAELARLREQEERRQEEERQARAARESAESAQREAQEAVERAERQAQEDRERAERAEQATREAEERAAQAEAEASERAAREAREAAERERADRERAERAEREAEERRKQEEANREQIEEFVAGELMREGNLHIDQAVRLVRAIACGDVEHLSIDYTVDENQQNQVAA